MGIELLLGVMLFPPPADTGLKDLPAEVTAIVKELERLEDKESRKRALDSLNAAELVKRIERVAHLGSPEKRSNEDVEVLKSASKAIGTVLHSLLLKPQPDESPADHRRRLTGLAAPHLLAMSRRQRETETARV